MQPPDNLVLVIAACYLGIASLGCGSASPPRVAGATPAERIADPNLSEPDALREAIRLADLAEPAPDPAGLLAVAGDERLSPERRRRAALLFWRRHASPGATLASVAGKVPRRARWPSREHVAIIPGLAGSVPIRVSPGTVFGVRAAFVDADRTTIYVRVEGRLREVELQDALDGVGVDGLEKSQILEVGYSLWDGADEPIVGGASRRRTEQQQTRDDDELLLSGPSVAPTPR
jgi:hypothetical protein